MLISLKAVRLIRDIRTLLLIGGNTATFLILRIYEGIEKTV